MTIDRIRDIFVVRKRSAKRPFIALFSALFLGAACSQPPQESRKGGSSQTSAASFQLDEVTVSAAESFPVINGTLVHGKARFTVVTQTLIRMEYDEEGEFLNEPTYFAVSRDSRYLQASVVTTEQGIVIDTGILKLSFINDGKPFSESNLLAEIREERGTTRFSPTAGNKDNLGGTTVTLDGWTGARALDDGILSRAGYFVLDDSQGHVRENGWIRERTHAQTDIYIFGYGHDYRAALASLTAIGGPVPMPRKYLFGSWYSRYWPYSSDDYKTIVKEYADHDFPLDVMVLDMDWHLDGWTGWTWNRSLIPDPADLMRFFHANGIASTVNVHPADGVAPHEEVYGNFMSALGRDPASHETVPFDAASQSYMKALLGAVHTPLDNVGVDFYWLDWQQGEFTLGLPKLRHIPWLNEQYFNFTARNGLRGVSFSRWGGWGDHRHPIHFSGDASTTFEMLAFEVPFTATSGNTGLFFWTHDIGGHMGARNEESYARWTQFGALSAALRSHSTRDPNLDRRPWTYSDWAYASMKKSHQLRSRLFPTIYSSAWQSSRDSVPLLRPMYLDAPELEEAYHQPQQYWFGDNLLVAPVVEPGVGQRRLGRQVVWFPQGIFYDFETGERFEGSGEHLVARAIDEIPLFAKGGVPIVMQPFTQHPARDQIAELVVRCFPGEDGFSGKTELHEDDGLSQDYLKGEYATTQLSCSRQGNEIKVSVASTKGAFQGQLPERSLLIEIPATEAASSAAVNGQGASVAYDDQTATNLVRISSRSIRDAAVITVVASPMDPDVLRQRAFAKRTGVEPGPMTVMLQKAWERASSSAEKQIILAAAGSGIYPKNETLYGFPKDASLKAYRESWAPIDVNIETIWDSVVKWEVGVIRYAGEMLRVTGSVLDLDWNRPGENIARSANRSFSSLELPETTGLTDQHVGGYPNNRAEEWSSHGEKAGAWVRLDWNNEQTVGEVVIFDRINANDQILGGELIFDDGSVVSTGIVPNTNSEGPLVIRFPPKRVRSMTFRVTSVSPSTENVGIAELAVYADSN